MLVKNFRKSKSLVDQLMRERSTDSGGTLLNVVKQTLAKRQAILALASKHQTPFYLFDKAALVKSVKEFKAAFQKFVAPFKFYYAVKSNHYPELLNTVVKNNLGLDVSSGRERIPMVISQMQEQRGELLTLVVNWTAGLAH
jgi:hypothetical protein